MDVLEEILEKKIATLNLNPCQVHAMEHIKNHKTEIQRQWTDRNKLFPYFVIDNFLPVPFAEQIYATYPPPEKQGWDNTTYVHQRKKFSKTSDFSDPVNNFFNLVNSNIFLDFISELTGIPSLLADPDYVGGGLHQIIRGGFLDVHVDFNFHPVKKHHRRANLLLYMNKDWESKYEGFLELWNMEDKHLVEKIAPIFNRVVMFETNEVSYHGHPKPLACPQNMTRKSLAVYYYTKELENRANTVEHNTLYKQTAGLEGYIKTLQSSVLASIERAHGKNGITNIGKKIFRSFFRKLRGFPPENK